jgi:4-hydroxybenzoate polyprenyltransferase
MQVPTPLAPTRWLRLRNRIDAYERLLRLDKPIGTALLLWPTLSALWFATDGAPSWLLVVVFVTGTALMRSAGCAVNDWADRRYDAHVERTATRPMATGEVAPWEALLLAAVLAFCAFLLVLATNRTAVLWSFPAALIAFVYPFCKRFFALPQAFLGIAFSFGIPMAFAAAQGQVPPFAFALTAINLFWVIAYDTEYAMVDRDDDLKIGIRTSAITFGRFDVAAIALCYAVYVVGMAWVGVERAMGPIYFVGVAVAALLAAYHLVLIRGRERMACLRAFLHNHWLGLAIFAGIALDFAIRLSAWPQR